MNVATVKSAKVTASLVGFLAFWEIACLLFDVPAYILPRPSLIVKTLVARWDLIAIHSIVTFYETLAGFILAVAFGVACAAVIVMMPALTDVIMPILLALQIVPKVAIAPVLLIWFGYGIFPKIFIAFLVAFFPIVVNCAQGLAAVEPALMDLARAAGATRWQIFRKFRVPTAMPYLLGGMKIAITFAIIGAVIGEFVGGSEGLGYLIIIANSELDTAMAFAALLVLSIGGIIMYVAVEACERFLMPWHQQVGDDKLRASP